MIFYFLFSHIFPLGFNQPLFGWEIYWKYIFSLLNAFKRANPGLVLFGLLFCTMSVFLRAVKAVLQDQLLEPTAYASRVDLEQGKGGVNGASPPSLSPMHVWALTAPPYTLLAFAYAVTTESLTSAFHELTTTSIFFVLISCLSATILNVLGLMSVKQLGASSMQIVGKLNTIVLLALSMGFWGESMPKEAQGLLV